MIEETIYTEISKLINVERDKLTEDFILNEHMDWDSLSLVSLIATIDAKCNVLIKAYELDECNSIKDIIDVIKRSEIKN